MPELDRSEVISFLNSLGCEAEAADLRSIKFAEKIIDALGGLPSSTEEKAPEEPFPPPS